MDYSSDVVVVTKNGARQITPVFCEVTGKLLGWATDKDFDPAYISLEVVNELGEIKRPDWLLKMETF